MFPQLLVSDLPFEVNQKQSPKKNNSNNPESCEVPESHLIHPVEIDEDEHSQNDQTNDTVTSEGCS